MPFLTQINKLHFTVKPGFKTLSTQAQAQAQQFVFHRESGLDTGMSASANTRIKIFPFLSCTCAYACVCAATSEIQALSPILYNFLYIFSEIRWIRDLKDKFNNFFFTFGK